MALQFRRGTNTDRLTITPAVGEPLYTTDTQLLYVGDGITAGGNLVSHVSSVNGLTGAVSLNSDLIPGGSHNLYFTNTLANDSVGQMIASGTLNGLTVSYNSTTHAITMSTVSNIQAGTTNSLAYYASNGTTLSPSSSIQWTEGGNNLNITNGNYSSISNYSGAQSLTFSTYANNALGNSLAFRKARGTNITPSALLSGDTVQYLNFQAYNGTSFENVAQLIVNTVGTVTSSIVPAEIKFYTNDAATGAAMPRLTLSGLNSPASSVTIGPSSTTDIGSGSLIIRQSNISSSTLAPLIISNYNSDTNGAAITMRKYRGTFLSYTPVLQNDVLAQISGKGYDGTSTSYAAQIQVIADGSVSTNIVPGAISFLTANNSGTLTQALKLDHSQTAYFGVNTANSIVSILGNGTSGTATITSNVTTGTANLFAGVTGSVNIGGITWTGANNTALIINNGGLQFSSASSVAAAGTNQGTATQLYADNNFITSGTGGVVLPAATTGREVSVTNNTGASINVYPQGTHTIESGSAGVPTVLPNLATISLMAKSGNNWWTIQPVYNGGTGVSITQSANGTVTWNIGQAVSTTSNVTFANVQTTGLTLRNVNFIAVASTATYALSTTTSYNVLVVSNTGLTVTVTMPPSPVDQQLCSFTIASNTVSTLNMTAGPTVIPPFNGSTNVTSGTVYQYVYRASTSTWYRN